MPDFLLPIIIGSGCSIGLGLFGKYFPKKKLVAMISKPCYLGGVWVSKFLMLKLGTKNAEKVEEGLFATICDSLAEGPIAFKRGLLADNKKKEKKDKDKK